MSYSRIFTGALFIMFLFFTAIDIQELAIDGTLDVLGYDFGEYSFIWLVIDFSILFSTYHDTWGRKK